MAHSLKRATVKIDILTLLAFMITARLCCPALSNLPFFSITFTFLYGLAFIGLYFLSRPKISRQELTIITVAIFYTLYAVIQSLIANTGIFSTEAFNSYVIVFFLFISIWAKNKPSKTQSALLILIFLALLFNYTYSIYVLRLDPSASRTAAATSVLEKSEYDVLSAVGSYDLVYGSIFIVLILLYMYTILEKRTFRRLVPLAISLLAINFIIMAAYATAIVLLIFAMALYFGERNKIVSILLILAAVLLIIFHEAVGQWLIDLAPSLKSSKMLRLKVNDLGEMIKDFEASGTYEGDSGRADRMRWSWQTFIQHPIFGGYAVKGAKIGTHSEFLDTLGRFGLVGFTALVLLFFNIYKHLMATLQTKPMRNCTRIVFLVYITTSILNPALFTLQVMPIILMLPLAESFCRLEPLPGKDETP